MAHSLAGQLVRAEDLIQIQPLIDAYYDLAPNPKDPCPLPSSFSNCP